jgi:hypothetical protein
LLVAAVDQIQILELLPSCQLEPQLIALPKFVGIEVTIYDPELDEDGSQAEKLATGLTNAFSRNCGKAPI